MFFKFRTDFHFSHELSLGDVTRWASNKVWLSKVPGLTSSGIKLLLKYHSNFVSISLERTMQCSCKSVPAYSGSFCSQIDKIWGSLRIFSTKKTKQRICQIYENKQSVETLLSSNFSHQLRLAYILQGKSFYRLGVSNRRRTISIISYHISYQLNCRPLKGAPPWIWTSRGNRTYCRLNLQWNFEPHSWA